MVKINSLRHEHQRRMGIIRRWSFEEEASKEAIHRHPRRVKSFLLGPILSKERWNVAFVPSAGSGLVSASKGTWGQEGVRSVKSRPPFPGCAPSHSYIDLWLHHDGYRSRRPSKKEKYNDDGKEATKTRCSYWDRHCK